MSDDDRRKRQDYTGEKKLVTMKWEEDFIRAVDAAAQRDGKNRTLWVIETIEARLKSEDD